MILELSSHGAYLTKKLLRMMKKGIIPKIVLVPKMSVQEMEDIDNKPPFKFGKKPKRRTKWLKKKTSSNEKHSN